MIRKLWGRRAAASTNAPPRRRTDADLVRRIAGFVHGFTIEAVPTSSEKVAAFATDLPPGTTVYVASPASKNLDDILDTARNLRRHGLRPVPHLAARNISDRDTLEDFLRRITLQAEVDEMLLIAGSRAKPAGAFDSSLAMLETGLLARCGIRTIGVAGYPEGHPFMARDVLMEQLRLKHDSAQRDGLQFQIVTQFCFDPTAAVAWARKARAQIGDVPIHVGIPGPATLTHLARYARICGIGESVRFLTRGASTAVRFATWSPDGFLTAIAAQHADQPTFQKAHFYTFGGVARTARWLAAVAAGRTTMAQDRKGFSITDDAPPHDAS